jgi:hypothetical protein
MTGTPDLTRRLDDSGGSDPAFDLHRLRAAVLHEPAGILGRLVRSRVSQEGHVADDQRRFVPRPRRRV